jgi:hypothetical protein
VISRPLAVSFPTGARVIAPKTFWDAHQGSVVPFLFYNLAEGYYAVVSNSTHRGYPVLFRGNWP